jgi:hypothetical protein
MDYVYAGVLTVVSIVGFTGLALMEKPQYFWKNFLGH